MALSMKWKRKQCNYSILRNAFPLNIIKKILQGGVSRRCGRLTLLNNSKNLVFPTTEELKKQELIETLAKLVKAYADTKRK